MLNLADLGFLLSILAGGVGAAGGASAEGASTFGVIACGVSGLLLGGALGAVANKLSYWLLDREPPNALLSVLAIVSYSVWPLGSSIGVGILAGWLGGSLVVALMAERSAADRSRQAASNTPRAATRMPIGLLTACGVFLLFIVLALNGSYAGTFFFWTGLLVSPFVGAIASITNGRRHRPLAIVGVATATAITLSFLAFGVCIFLLNDGY